MTEPNNTFGGATVTEPPTAMTPPEWDNAGEGGNRRQLMIVGIVVGVIVLAAAAYFLLFKGSSTPTATAPLVRPSVAQSAASPAAGTVAGKTVVLPKKVKQPNSRNPFSPLVTTPSPQVSTGTSGGTKSTSTTTTTGNGTSTATSSGSQPSTGKSTGTTTTTANAVYVQLDAVQGVQSAIFTIGYSNGKTKLFKVVAPAVDGPGTAFASNFTLLGIEGNVVTVQYVDGAPFDLHEGFAQRHAV